MILVTECSAVMLVFCDVTCGSGMRAAARFFVKLHNERHGKKKYLFQGVLDVSGA